MYSACRKRYKSPQLTSWNQQCIVERLDCGTYKLNASLRRQKFLPQTPWQLDWAHICCSYYKVKFRDHTSTYTSSFGSSPSYIINAPSIVGQTPSQCHRMKLRHLNFNIAPMRPTIENAIIWHICVLFVRHEAWIWLMSCRKIWDAELGERVAHLGCQLYFKLWFKVLSFSHP